MTSTVLITGANRGIGLEFVRRYLEDGWFVHACCRNPENAVALNDLGAGYKDSIQLHPLDVLNDKHIDTLRAVLAGKPLDVLINNAGIYGPGKVSFGEVDEAAWLEIFRIDTIAPFKIAAALIDNIGAGERKIIAHMSSKMGSIDDNGSGGSYMYRSAKAALNMVTKSMAIDLAPRGVKVVCLHPGWVLTDMGGPNAEISVAQSVEGLKGILDTLGMEQSGRFIEYDGSIIPW